MKKYLTGIIRFSLIGYLLFFVFSFVVNIKLLHLAVSQAAIPNWLTIIAIIVITGFGLELSIMLLEKAYNLNILVIASLIYSFLTLLINSCIILMPSMIGCKCVTLQDAIASADWQIAQITSGLFIISLFGWLIMKICSLEHKLLSSNSE